MKNLFILIILGLVIAYFVAGNHSAISFDIDKILDQYHVSKSRVLSLAAGFKANKGESEKAIQLFDDSEKAISEIKDVAKRIKESLNIAEKKLKTTETISETVEEDIKQIVKEIENMPDEEKEVIFNDVADILFEMDLKPEDLSSEIGNVTDESLFLFNVALLYLEEGNRDLAIETIRKITDEYHKKVAIMILLNKSFDNETGLIQEFQDSAIKDFIYLNNLRNILNNGDLAKAKEIIKSFEGDFLRKMGWLEIFNFQVKKGNINSAVEILQTEID
ncbi:hypothetical protein ACFL05_00590 [Patescibacteria group bacterium]